MRNLSLLAATAVAVLVFTACDPNNGGNENGRTQYPSTADVIRNAVKDVDGNKYDAVRIGDQVWMASNLKTTHYADGTAIPQGTTISETTAYRYCPDNNPQTVDKYGYLYNWSAVMHDQASSEANPSGVQGICPKGWHVPSDAEWEELEEHVSSQSAYRCDGDEFYIAKALASKDGWEYDDDDCTVGNNSSANNATGFSAVPAGGYDSNDYYGFGYYAYFWSATQSTSNYVCYRLLYKGRADVICGSNDKDYGYSVRCLRD